MALFRYMRDLANKHQGIYRFWCFPFGAVFIYNPHDIEVSIVSLKRRSFEIVLYHLKYKLFVYSQKVLSSMKYHEKSELYTLLQPWLQDGLLLSSGKKFDLCLIYLVLIDVSN